jgi:aminoglycoside 3-N-acetyltransferase
VNTPADLSNALIAMGLVAGDSLIMHSSFRSLKPFDAGPLDVVDVILNIIGPSGNLMLPTFGYSTSLPEPYFDVDQTPGRTGAINELGRCRSGAVRSLHPTHSVAVIGPDANQLTANHLSNRTVGVGSPIDRLAKLGGKVLLLGVDHTANTMIHIGEEHAKQPKVGRAEPNKHPKVRMPDGSIIEHKLDSSTSCSAGFQTLDAPMRAAGAVNDSRLGECAMMLMRGQDIIDIVVRMLNENRRALMCDNSDCRYCRGTERNLRIK